MLLIILIVFSFGLIYSCAVCFYDIEKYYDNEYKRRQKEIKWIIKNNPEIFMIKNEGTLLNKLIIYHYRLDFI